MTIEALEPLEAVDLPADVDCEVKGSPEPVCLVKAAWWLVCRRCGNPLAMCEKHRLWVLGVVRVAGFAVVCLRCATGSDSLAEQYRVFPIGDMS